MAEELLIRLLAMPHVFARNGVLYINRVKRAQKQQALLRATIGI